MADDKLMELLEEGSTCIGDGDRFQRVVIADLDPEDLPFLQWAEDITSEQVGMMLAAEVITEDKAPRVYDMMFKNKVTSYWVRKQFHLAVWSKGAALDLTGKVDPEALYDRWFNGFLPENCYPIETGGVQAAEEARKNFLLVKASHEKAEAEETRIMEQTTALKMAGVNTDDPTIHPETLPWVLKMEIRGKDEQEGNLLPGPASGSPD